MKKLLYIIPIFILFLASCKKYEDVGNPNGPSLEDFERTTTLEDLKLVAVGMEAALKTDVSYYNDEVGIIGREVIDLSGVDPRYTGELLGAAGGPLDPGGFLTTRPYSRRYQAVRVGQILIDAMETTEATLTDKDKNGFIGYAKTLQAYQELLNANMQYQNGLRSDVSDPDNLGEFVSYDANMENIASKLNEAYTLLMDSEDNFKFNLTSGFSGFDTPETFAKFNRALSARVSLYQGNNAKALTDLGNSFYDMGSGFYIGAYHSYNAADGGLNPMYHTDNFMANPAFIADAEAGDSRLSKVMATDTATVDGISSHYRANIYQSPTDNAIIIRNEELILIYAEANIGTNNAETVVAIDAIRNAAGIGAYTGGTSDDELLNEVLNQRRYSLFGEGHRWVDMRRHDKLNELSIYRAGDIVHVQFPRPQTEEF